jgi:hypothetical protein
MKALRAAGDAVVQRITCTNTLKYLKLTPPDLSSLP